MTVRGSVPYSDRPAEALRGGQSRAEEALDRPAAPVRTSRGDDLAALLRELTPGLLRLGSRYRLPPEELEDALQEALLRFVRVRTQVADPAAWLNVAMRRECLRLAARRKRWREVAIADASAVADRSDELASWIREHDLRSALATLKPRQRDLLRWRYLEGLESVEIAERCGCRPSSLKRLLARARLAAHRRLNVPVARRQSLPGAVT